MLSAPHALRTALSNTILLMANHICANCGHAHPATTRHNITRVSGKCDSCECVTFRHGLMLNAAAAKHGRLDSNDVPAHALAMENESLKKHVAELRERVPETDGAFASKEMDALRSDAADAHVKLANAHISYGQTVRELKQTIANLAAALDGVNVLAASLRTIVAGNYSAYSHEAVRNGVNQISDTLNAALTLLTK